VENNQNNAIFIMTVNYETGNDIMGVRLQSWNEYLCLFFNHWKLVFSSEKEVNKLQFFLALYSVLS
jgi:hypothetical protein